MDRAGLPVGDTEHALQVLPQCLDAEYGPCRN